MAPPSPPPRTLAAFDRLMARATTVRKGGKDEDDGSKVPNAAVLAAGKDGKIIHSASFGTYVPAPIPPPHRSGPQQSSKAPSSPGPDLGAEQVTPQPFTPSTVCWMASCTKLMATVAALQCVERGLLSIDGDISDVLPEFANPDILVKMTDGGPQLRKATKRMTLRHLLTHSNGTAYDFSHPKTAAYRAWAAEQYRAGKMPRPKDPVHRQYLVPLLYEPGEGWSYGYGTDWAGIAVSRATGLGLEEYMRTNIWNPLGMDSTTFYPFKRPDLLPRIAGMAERGEDGKLRPTDPRSPWARPPGGWTESGGGGCYGPADDYIKLLLSLLRNDGKVLKPETRDMMFRPQLQDPKYLRAVHSSPLASGLADNIPHSTSIDFGFGGLLNLETVEKTGRAPGAIQWGGLPNLFWWINPEDGVCGCYWGQLLPPGDPVSFGYYEAFETAVNHNLKDGRNAKL